MGQVRGGRRQVRGLAGMGACQRYVTNSTSNDSRAYLLPSTPSDPRTVTAPGYFWRNPGGGAAPAGTTCPADHYCTGRVPAAQAQPPTLCTAAYSGSETGSLQSPQRSDEMADCGKDMVRAMHVMMDSRV